MTGSKKSKSRKSRKSNNIRKTVREIEDSHWKDKYLSKREKIELIITALENLNNDDIAVSHAIVKWKDKLERLE